MPIGPGVTTPSLGNAFVHPLREKLKQAAFQGLKYLEVVEDDILVTAQKLDGGITDANQVEAAKIVKSLCNELDLIPYVLQPFWFYEGLVDRKEHEAQIKKLRLWMDLVKALGIQLIQIPTNWLAKGTTDDVNLIIKDLVEMAEIGLAQEPAVSFAYEAVAWGTHIDTWEGSWEIVKHVNKPNFGLCLDTYHILARIWGDPTLPECRSPTGDADLQQSLDRMAKDVDVKKIFMVQLGDAELLRQPLVAGHAFHSDERKPRMSWSRNARLFAWDDTEPGCLPLEAILKTLMKDLKYDGFVTMETFSAKLFVNDPEIPAKYAAKAMKSWNEMMKRLE